MTEKLPSFYILYPKQEYEDIQTFGFSYGGAASYVYHTMPYTIRYNPGLRWQRGSNAELGIDAEYQQTLADAMAKLPPMQVGQYGQLQEWRPWRAPSED